jgi:putative ubiquitin-RnfH superfamily antitoxin RatB of RatAB toxin-antitoxin module
MDEQQLIKVEVAYALPEDQQIFSLNVDRGTTIEQAIHLSGILEHYADIDLGNINKVGIFGKLAKLDKVLQEGDRVEIYRPLQADPKEVRRKRAAEGKVMTKGAASKTGEDSKD